MRTPFLQTLGNMILILLHGLLISLATSDPTDNMPLKDTSAVAQPETEKPGGVNASSCPLGCLACSRWNGCTECATNFTWHLRKIYMRKIGLCLRDCPTGYFKGEFKYAPGHYRCIECKAQHCEVCGSEDFCDICVSPYLEYRGSCILKCPENLHHSKYRKDCFRQVDCLVSGWSKWQPCVHNGHTCGYKWGNQTRNRTLLQTPSSNGLSCPDLVQTQRCKLEQRFCSVDNGMERGSKHRRRHQKQKARRRIRCKLLRGTGKRCKKRHYSPNKYPPLPPDGISHLLALNESTYFNYYKQSAELLKLLNTHSRDRKKPRDKKKTKLDRHE